MKDGKIAHMVRCVKNAIQGNLSDELVISRTSLISWSAISPDLNPCGFWLCCFRKDHVYQRCVTNLADLKVSIVRSVSLITTDMIRAAVDNAVLSFQHIVETTRYAHRAHKYKKYFVILKYL